MRSWLAGREDVDAVGATFDVRFYPARCAVGP